MKEIQNMEYNLYAIRYLFKLQEVENIRAHGIHLYSDYGFLKGSDFKVEALDYAVKYDTPILKRKFKKILSLSNEILNLWDEKICKIEHEVNPQYEIYGNLFRDTNHPFKVGELIFLKRIDNGSEIKEYTGNTFIEDYRFWSEISPSSKSEIENIFNLANGFTYDTLLIEFIYKIRNFIYFEILNEQTDPLQFEEKTTILINALKQYKFIEFLNNNNYEAGKINQLIDKHSGKELMPYTIALLSEIKFLDYFFKEFTDSKEEGFKRLSKIFNITERRIKGNVNILNSNSKEDPTQYTSINYTELVQSDLKGLQ